MKRKPSFRSSLALTLLTFGSLLATAADISSSIQAIRNVGPEGKGNLEAAAAVRWLSQQEVGALPTLLAGMDGANELSANWLRSSIEAVVQRQKQQGKSLPVAEIGAFLLDTRHDPKARELAFDLLSQLDSGASRALLAGMLNDPSMTLRRGSVQRLLDQAAKAKSDGTTNTANLLYQQALTYVRDVDQIQSITDALKALGQKTDLPALFGWVQNWKVIGPFDNTKRAGFDQGFPPETEINLSATYDGKGGKVKWVDLNGTDDYGKIDVNLPLGKLKETIAYCYTELHSPKAQSVEIRLGCKNAWKVWLNGKLLFGRDEYHRGAEIDQYRLPAELNAGKNALLVKLGQNEQKEEWTVEWEFQLRVTDALGTPITPLRVGVPPPTTAALSSPTPFAPNAN
ncbi:MAG: hypothetical protein JNN07_19905 [Verrucomicrobiales bacterium]|nr:hypothetical protein [Verrucomicrobiales bacterium]